MVISAMWEKWWWKSEARVLFLRQRTLDSLISVVKEQVRKETNGEEWVTTGDVLVAWLLKVRFLSFFSLLSLQLTLLYPDRALGSTTLERHSRRLRHLQLSLPPRRLLSLSSFPLPLHRRSTLPSHLLPRPRLGPVLHVSGLSRSLVPTHLRPATPSLDSFRRLEEHQKRRTARPVPKLAPSLRGQTPVALHKPDERRDGVPLRPRVRKERRSNSSSPRLLLPAPSPDRARPRRVDSKG
jgi:hypothetical protein